MEGFTGPAFVNGLAYRRTPKRTPIVSELLVPAYCRVVIDQLTESGIFALEAASRCPNPTTGFHQ